MPWTMLDATCPLFGLASPASTAESNVKNAAPMQISRFVRTPAAICACTPAPGRSSRPAKRGNDRRGMAPLKRRSAAGDQLNCRRVPKSTIMRAMSCTWLSPWLMLSPATRRFIAICRRGWYRRRKPFRRLSLSATFEPRAPVKPFGMSFHCLVDLVAIECQARSRRGWPARPARPEVVFPVALVDGLSQRNPVNATSFG